MNNIHSTTMFNAVTALIALILVTAGCSSKRIASQESRDYGICTQDVSMVQVSDIMKSSNMATTLRDTSLAIAHIVIRTYDTRITPDTDGLYPLAGEIVIDARRETSSVSRTDAVIDEQSRDTTNIYIEQSAIREEIRSVAPVKRSHGKLIEISIVLGFCFVFIGLCFLARRKITP